MNSIIAGWSDTVARRAHNPKVAGSNPVPATKWSRGVVVNMPACHAGDRRFDPVGTAILIRLGSSVGEQRTENPRVGGSIPSRATIYFNKIRRLSSIGRATDL